jgi:hypothetical protein
MPWKRTWIVDFWDGNKKIKTMVIEGKNAPTRRAQNEAWCLRRQAQGREVRFSIELVD